MPVYPAHLQYPLDLYLVGGPEVFIFNGNYANDPDSNGFRWGWNTSATTPAYNIGCIKDVSMSPRSEKIDITCDNRGLVRSINRLEGYDIRVTLHSLFDLDHLRRILNASAYYNDSTNKIEFLGLGAPAYNTWKVLLYKKEGAHEIGVYLHSCLINLQEWTFAGNGSWNIQCTITVLATNYPEEHRFGTVVHVYP